MRLEVRHGIQDEKQVDVRVHLSRRNLVSLLAKLEGYPRGSACELYKIEEGGDTVTVIAEPDGDHYGDRGYPPGPVHAETAIAIAKGDVARKAIEDAAEERPA